MKRIVLTTAITLGFATGAALAGGETSSATLDLMNITTEQLDALTSILAGLPRQ